MKILIVSTILFFWFVISLSVISVSFLINPQNSSLKALDFLIASSSRNILSSPTNIGAFGDVLAAVKGGDVRPVLIERFLARYNSPMIGMGEEFVSAADKNSLDWRLLPALAFQESNLGKKIPKGSYNPFGWTVYSGKNSGTYFDNWEQAINIVAARMKTNYIDQGFSTPETIVIRYTSSNNPTWVFAVRSAMEEISGTAY